MDNFDYKKYLAENKLLKEDMTSKAVSILKSYKGEVKGLEDYIEYLRDERKWLKNIDDISSSIQAVADNMDRNNDAEDSLRRDLEKLSLAEGKLIKEEDDGYDKASQELFGMTWDEVRKRDDPRMRQDVHDEVQKDDEEDWEDEVDEYLAENKLVREDRFEDVEHIFKGEVDPTGKTEVEWVDSSDRHILIKRGGSGEVVGLNYMQGEEDPGFEDDDRIEPKLSEFYIKNKDMVKGKTELEVIDNAIWLYFNAITQE